MYWLSVMLVRRICKISSVRWVFLVSDIWDFPFSIHPVSVSKHLSQLDLCVTPGGHEVLKYSSRVHIKRLSVQTPSPGKTSWENKVGLSATSSPLTSQFHIIQTKASAAKNQVGNPQGRAAEDKTNPWCSGVSKQSHCYHADVDFSIFHYFSRGKVRGQVSVNTMCEKPTAWFFALFFVSVRGKAGTLPGSSLTSSGRGSLHLEVSR